MISNVQKLILIIAAIALVSASGFNQKAMNSIQRDVGLTRVEPLENAPPMLAFSTVALGGFRGIIANLLWMRANRLQVDGKYFELVQLSDWITKLQPNFTHVWKHLAWNMSYNISRNFRSKEDRWLWVQSGLELLRDRAIPLNPNKAVLYEELAWILHDKMGKKIDDAHFHFKEIWAQEFNELIMNYYPDLQVLVDPKNEDQKESAQRLREVHKMDPVLILEIEEKYGPLDWRITDSHAIYWAAQGLKKSPEKSIVLKRAIWQSMKATFDRGRLIVNPWGQSLEYGPNLAVAEKVNQIILELIDETPEKKEYISRAHKNFLEDATYYFFTHNLKFEANQYFQKLQELYPDAVQEGVLIEDFVVERVITFSDLNPARARLLVEGYLQNYFYYVALQEDEIAMGNYAMAEQVRQKYNQKVKDRIQEIGLPSIEELGEQKAREIISRKLSTNFTPEMIDVLKARVDGFAELEPKPEIDSEI